MTFVKWAVVFLVAFALAFIIIVTFSQPEFQVRVSAHLFTYQTKALPVWMYVAGALCLGLVTGLSVAVYYNVILRTALHRKDREIKTLETELHASQAAAGAAPIFQEPAGDDAL